MNPSKRVINAKVIRARTIQANKIQAKQLQFGRKFCFKKGTGLVQIKRKLRELRLELHKDVRQLKHKIRKLRNEISAIQEELVSGLVPNPALEAFFKSKLGQTVTVTTSSGAITGIVVLVATDSVELRENNGDLVLIPYSHITSAQ